MGDRLNDTVCSVKVKSVLLAFHSCYLQTVTETREQMEAKTGVWKAGWEDVGVRTVVLGLVLGFGC